jgi:hypothetical protein
MTPFEFVFALISIISSLALTKIITGVVAIIRHRERGGFSATHALWVWVAFAVVVGNWGALWGARLDPHWPALRVLAWLTSMTSLYAFCALVLPEAEDKNALNLAEFHEREGARYIIAHNVFALIALLLVVTIGGVAHSPLRNILSPIAALALGTAALLTKGRLQLAASLLLAILATGFMISSISILPTGAQQ